MGETSVVAWIGENTLIAAVLAVVAAVVCRYTRSRPALGHFLWVMVLVALLAPPLPVETWPSSRIREPLQAAWESTRTVWQGSSRIPSQPPRDFEPPAERSGSVAVERTDTGARVAAPLAGGASHIPRLGSPRPEPVAATPTVAGTPISSWLVRLWLTGSVLVLLIQLRRLLVFRRLVRRAAAAPAALVSRVRAIGTRIGARAPDVRVLDRLGSPFVWCLGRPVLLWPARDEEQPHSGESAILAHELAHLRRRDHWVSWLELVGSVVCWWNPLFWLARRRIRQQAELACDAWALWAFPRERRAYASALIDNVERLSAAPVLLAQLRAGEADRRSFEGRLRMIMERKLSRKFSPLWAVLAVAVVLSTWPAASIGLQPSAAPSRATKSASVDRDVEPAVQAQIHAMRGHRYYESGDWQEAAAEYEKLVALDPDNEKALSRLGQSLLQSGQADAAIAVFRQQLDLGRNGKWAELNLARAYALAGDAGGAVDHLSAAIRAGFHEAEELMDPDFAAVRDNPEFNDLVRDALTLGKLMKDAKQGGNRGTDWSASVDSWSRAVAIAPDSEHALRSLGYSQLMAGRNAEATDTYLRLVQMTDKPALAYYNLACAASLNGETETAFDYLERSIEAGFHDAKHIAGDDDLASLRDDPRFEQLRELAGSRDELKHDLMGAIKREEPEQLVQAAEAHLADDSLSDEDRGEVYDELGMALHGMQRFEDALEAFRQQAIHGHNVTTALYNVACCHARLGNTDRAFDYLNRAVDAGLGNPGWLKKDDDLASLHADPRFEPLVRRASDQATLASLNAVDWEHLESNAERRIAASPNDGEAYSRLGWARWGQGDTSGAIQAFREQDRLGHKRMNARYNIACCYALKGDAERAFDWLDEAREAGFDDAAHLREDPDLMSLRGDPRFQEMLDTLDDSDSAHKLRLKQKMKGKERVKRKPGIAA